MSFFMITYEESTIRSNRPKTTVNNSFLQVSPRGNIGGSTAVYNNVKSGRDPANIRVVSKLPVERELSAM